MKLASFETASPAFPGNSLADSAEDLKFLRLKLKKWYKVSEWIPFIEIVYPTAADGVAGAQPLNMGWS